MKDPRALANTLIRLQKAEGRLSDYISNFPGIFFTQRTDLTFSYLSNGISKLFLLNIVNFTEMAVYFSLKSSSKIGNIFSTS